MGAKRCEANPERVMSILLQSLDTMKYVGRPSGWTERPELAREFGGGTEALFYCYQHHLDHMRILGQFADARQNFTIPLNTISFGQTAE
jgi:hypothetical protein